MGPIEWFSTNVGENFIESIPNAGGNFTIKTILEINGDKMSSSLYLMQYKERSVDTYNSWVIGCKACMRIDGVTLRVYTINGLAIYLG